MFNATSLTNSLTLPKIIGGISKTLQIANQIIPLYQKAKPLITNARSIMSIMKEMGQKVPKTIEAKEVVTTKEKQEKKEETNASPTFFL